MGKKGRGEGRHRLFIGRKQYSGGSGGSMSAYPVPACRLTTRPSPVPPPSLTHPILCQGYRTAMTRPCRRAAGN